MSRHLLEVPTRSVGAEMQLESPAPPLAKI
jgi:hypothetical protein